MVGKKLESGFHPKSTKFEKERHIARTINLWEQQTTYTRTVAHLSYQN